MTKVAQMGLKGGAIYPYQKWLYFHQKVLLYYQMLEKLLRPWLVHLFQPLLYAILIHIIYQMKAFVILTLFVALFSIVSSQQVCVRDQCLQQWNACDQACVVLMGNCTQSCTLSSLGCLQKCIGANQPAQNLLECSFNKCINLWSSLIY